MEFCVKTGVFDEKLGFLKDRVFKVRKFLKNMEFCVKTGVFDEKLGFLKDPSF